MSIATEAPDGLDMCTTCDDASNMSTMIQLRNVPDHLHRTLKSRAALEGMSLSDYCIAELRRFAERPTVDELLARLATREPVKTSISAEDAVRAERDSR